MNSEEDETGLTRLEICSHAKAPGNIEIKKHGQAKEIRIYQLNKMIQCLGEKDFG